MNSTAVVHLLYTERVGGSIPSSPINIADNKMLTAKCKVCNSEILSNSKTQCCGCPNQMVVHGDTITAKDLSMVLLINSEKSIKEHGVLTTRDLEYQENRRKRKVRKLDFEVR